MRGAERERGRGGFTTLEMLLTTLILALATMVGASGVYTTNAVYQRTMAKSDAQMLYSQAEARLRDEIGFAKEVQASGKSLLYSKTRGNEDVWYAVVESDGKLCRYDIPDPNAPGAPTELDLKEDDCVPLVTYDKDRMEDLKVTYDSVDDTDKAKGYVTVRALKIERDGSELAGGDIVIPWTNAGL